MMPTPPPPVKGAPSPAPVAFPVDCWACGESLLPNERCMLRHVGGAVVYVAHTECSEALRRTPASRMGALAGAFVRGTTTLAAEVTP